MTHKLDPRRLSSPIPVSPSELQRNGKSRADNSLINIALNNGFAHGVLSSRIHVTWALAAGGRLGVGNDPRYNKTRCFETFPFPATDNETTERIRNLGEQLDAHRKRQQELHPDLTMTGMYNVLEKLRAVSAGVQPSGCAVGEEQGGVPEQAEAWTPTMLTKKELDIHDKGLVSVLKQIHDDLDAAVFDAYGWPHDLDDKDILQRLVDLNHERAAEEAAGHIRWLRPEFQNPDAATPTQQKLDIKTVKKPAAAKPAKANKRPWPSALPEKVAAVRDVLCEQTVPAATADISKHFTRAHKATVEEILDTLVTIGQARQTDDGRYVA